MSFPYPLTASGERLALPGRDTPRSSRRDDQTRETKRRLIGAAIGLLADVGWRRTTIEQIAERAGVAKGTFFVHFKTKEAIVLTLVQLQVGAALAAREAVFAKGGSAVDALRATTVTLGKQAGTSLELSRGVLIASLESREVAGATDEVFTELYRRMIEDAQVALDQGLLEGPPATLTAKKAETIASLLMSSYLGATLRCASAPSAKPMAEVLAPLVDATLAALAPRGTGGAGAKRKANAKKKANANADAKKKTKTKTKTKTTARRGPP